jgi:hypothetical protein
MRHSSLGSLVASIRSEQIVLPSSSELTTTVPGQCHHTPGGGDEPGYLTPD